MWHAVREAGARGSKKAATYSDRTRKKEETMPMRKSDKSLKRWLPFNGDGCSSDENLPFSGGVV